MSMFDDIALVRSEFDDSWLIESLEAVERLDALRQQYEALAPDWADAPEWAQWYTIDAKGRGIFWKKAEPVIVNTRWDASGWYLMNQESPTLPIGIDWRLCKWQRPA